jgi:ribosome biogenesis GTPase
MHTTNQGTVYKKIIGHYVVHAGDRIVTCEITNRLRKDLLYPIADPTSIRRHVVSVHRIQAIDPVAVGDEVRFVENADGSGLITEVLPRRSALIRREATGSSARHAFEQVVVANLDQVVPVFSAARPAPSWALLDRYLVSAESLDLPSLICITKLDLDTDSDIAGIAEVYRRIGYQVILTSAVSGDGITELADALRGKVSVLVGKSGVGKTSLLNAIHPGLGLRVNAVSGQTGKGMHTTSNLEMIPFEEDGGPAGSVIDTPGIREFGLWNVDDSDLALMFPEMRSYVGTCRFGMDCSHDKEPGCAIRQAIAAGNVSQERYESMLKLRAG